MSVSNIHPEINELNRARTYLQQGDYAMALQWAAEAAHQHPKLEEPWLILAALCSPDDRLRYLCKALEINPKSVRARKGLRWALRQSRQQSVIPSNPPLISRNVSYTIQPLSPTQGGITLPQPHPPSRSQLVNEKPVSTLGYWLTALVLSFGIVTSLCVSAFLLLLWPHQASAQASMSDPFTTVVSVDFNAGSHIAAIAPTNIPDAEISIDPNLLIVTQPPLPSATATPAGPAETHVLHPQAPVYNEVPVQVLPDESQQVVIVPPMIIVPPIVIDTSISPVLQDNEKIIEVNLSQQMVYAIENQNIVRSFVVSTGTEEHPTVTGEYLVYVKHRYANMSGPGYHLVDVPFVMYFYKGYGLHGTYWHNNFGTPMSHGCVNLITADAEWLFDWTPVGTLVHIYY
jgi:lipoprotein-anchoring transpeptidase ErfK/SrfK